MAQLRPRHWATSEGRERRKRRAERTWIRHRTLASLCRSTRAFSQDRLGLWDAVIHPNLKSNSPARRNIEGIVALKRWNQSFIDSFRPRTDFVDHFVAGDRGLVTIIFTGSTIVPSTASLQLERLERR